MAEHVLTGVSVMIAFDEDSDDLRHVVMRDPHTNEIWRLPLDTASATDVAKALTMSREELEEAKRQAVAQAEAHNRLVVPSRNGASPIAKP